MNTRTRIEHSSFEQTYSFFTNPTNHTYQEFLSEFGKEVADSVFHHLYKDIDQSRFFRQLIPIRMLHERNTKKYVFQLYDHNLIETVCIKRRTGTTICISTQVGCAVKCEFCKSGEHGFIRNLCASEIVQQLLFVDEKVNRIVFMGIGEPLYNYSELLKAIKIMRDRQGIDFPTDGITISTVGPIDKLSLLQDEHIKIQLVLSLHATDQKTRDFLIPGMAKFQINEVVAAAMKYGRRHNRSIIFGYLLLPGINDKDADIEKLIQWFSGKDVVVNLMQYNGTETGYFKKTSKMNISKVKNRLLEGGVNVTVRESLGESINAACGQLSNKYR